MTSEGDAELEFGVPRWRLVTGNGFLKVEKGAGDCGGGRKIDKVDFVRHRSQSDGEELLRVVRRGFVACELFLVEVGEELGFLAGRRSVQEALEGGIESWLDRFFFLHQLGGQDTGGFDEGRVIELVERLQRGVAAFTSRGAFLACRGIECDEHGVKKGTLPVHVNTATVLIVVVVLLILSFGEVELCIVSVRLIGTCAGTTDLLVEQAGNGESVITNEFGRETTWILAGVEIVVRIFLHELRRDIGRLLVGLRGDDEFDEMLHVPTGLHELYRKPIEQCGMSGPLSLVAEVLQVAG